jgi:hypothetical protein
MIEKAVKYPAYAPQEVKMLSHKVSICLTYEQIIEIASVFYYVNLVLARLPRWLGGLKLDESKRVLHKAIHNAAVNCCLSLEEKYHFEQEGGKND